MNEFKSFPITIRLLGPHSEEYEIQKSYSLFRINKYWLSTQYEIAVKENLSHLMNTKL